MNRERKTVEWEYAQITALAKERRSITRRDVSELLGLSDGQAYYRLNILVERGVLTRTNHDYQLRSETIRPEERGEALCDYLSEHSTVTIPEAAALLRIGKDRAKRLMDSMLMDGRLAVIRETGTYVLPRGRSER